MQCLCFQQSFGSPRCKPHWFSQPNVLGACLSYAGPRVGVADVGFKPLALQRGALCCSIPPTCGSLHWGWGLCLSYPFRCGLFILYYGAAILLVFRENCSTGSSSFDVFIGGCELRDIFLCFLIFLNSLFLLLYHLFHHLETFSSILCLLKAFKKNQEWMLNIIKLLFSTHGHNHSSSFLAY